MRFRDHQKLPKSQDRRIKRVEKSLTRILRHVRVRQSSCDSVTWSTRLRAVRYFLSVGYYFLSNTRSLAAIAHKSKRTRIPPSLVNNILLPVRVQSKTRTPKPHELEMHLLAAADARGVFRHGKRKRRAALCLWRPYTALHLRQVKAPFVQQTKCSFVDLSNSYTCALEE